MEKGTRRKNIGHRSGKNEEETITFNEERGNERGGRRVA